jgi:hypothetical protein
LGGKPERYAVESSYGLKGPLPVCVPVAQPPLLTTKVWYGSVWCQAPPSERGSSERGKLVKYETPEPPQTLAMPPPPQVAGAVHEPQESVPLQPSAIDPQFFPCAWHVVGVQVAASGVTGTSGATPESVGVPELVFPPP